MKADELTALDYLFDLYDVNDEDQQQQVRKKINIEYTTYNRLLSIADNLQFSIQELLTFIFILYHNEYKLNNVKS
jgi:hypothetical protein